MLLYLMLFYLNEICSMQIIKLEHSFNNTLPQNNLNLFSPNCPDMLFKTKVYKPAIQNKFQNQSRKFQIVLILEREFFPLKIF